jgi:hypothetical protein
MRLLLDSLSCSEWAPDTDDQAEHRQGWKEAETDYSVKCLRLKGRKDITVLLRGTTGLRGPSDLEGKLST